uniref:Uncharacterized protein n=1 Tax=Salix viminalis TaxID=40686 RepID=A0A6N2NJ27_SALVM
MRSSDQSYQFRSVQKTETKRRRFCLGFNSGPFRKFRPERLGFIPGVPFRVQNQKFKTTPKEKKKEKAPLHSRLSSLCGWGGDCATKGKGGEVGHNDVTLRRFENARNKVGLNPDYLFSDGCIFGYCSNRGWRT